MDQRRLSAGLGRFAGGLKVSFRVDKSCFPGGPKAASWVDQRTLSADLGWFAGGLKVFFPGGQRLLPGWTKSYFPGGK